MGSSGRSWRLLACLACGLVSSAGTLLAPACLPRLAAGASSTDPSSFTVYHGTAAGSGDVAGILTVDTSAPAWKSPVLDGEIYGEPLVDSGRVFVATENDTVYALDSSTGAVVWSRHVGTPVPSGELPCGDITPVVGITGTPVIDPSRNEIFVVADENVGLEPTHRLVGLDLTSGAVEMTVTVDPPGAETAAILQRTGLTLAGGKVVFGFGGNDGDCSTYHGWVVAVGESGGSPADFEVDSASGDDQGAIWMGGAAPAVDAAGDIFVEAGNGSVHSNLQPYDDSDSVLELSPSMHLLQYFAPASWASDNAEDLDLSMEPVLLPDGDIVAAGKSRTAYLLSGRHLGGIGGQETQLARVCSNDIDGGAAVASDTVFLPCESGIVAISANLSPALSLLWSSGTGGGPPLLAAGRVWTIGQNGELYGLDPASGKVLQEALVGAPANHFPTPCVGDGFLLAPTADTVVAFQATSSSGTSTTTTSPLAASTTTVAGSTTTSSSPAHGRSGGDGLPDGAVAGIVVAGVAVGASIGYLVLRRRRERHPDR